MKRLKAGICVKQKCEKVQRSYCNCSSKPPRRFCLLVRRGLPLRRHGCGLVSAFREKVQARKALTKCAKTPNTNHSILFYLLGDCYIHLYSIIFYGNKLERAVKQSTKQSTMKPGILRSSLGWLSQSSYVAMPSALQPRDTRLCRSCAVTLLPKLYHVISGYHNVSHNYT